MKMLTALAIASTLAVSSSAFADEALAKKDGCLVCHDANMKKVGPSWKTVAAKLKGKKDAVKIIEDNIAHGGKGVYGPIAMPAQPKAIPDAEALAKYILSY